MDANIVPPEEKGEGTFVNKTVHVRDVWAVSLLLKEMFSEEEMSSKPFGDSLREMLSICASLNPSQRPNVASLLKHKLFASSSFIQTAEFLSNLTTMEENLKSKFFKELINKLPLLSFFCISLIILEKQIAGNLSGRPQRIHFTNPPLSVHIERNPRTTFSPISSRSKRRQFQVNPLKVRLPHSHHPLHHQTIRREGKKHTDRDFEAAPSLCFPLASPFAQNHLPQNVGRSF